MFLLLTSCLKASNCSLSTRPQVAKDPILFTLGQDPKMVFADIKDKLGELFRVKLSRLFHELQPTRVLTKVSSSGWNSCSKENDVRLCEKYKGYFIITTWTGDVNTNFSSFNFKNGDLLWNFV